MEISKQVMCKIQYIETRAKFFFHNLRLYFSFLRISKYDFSLFTPLILFQLQFDPIRAKEPVLRRNSRREPLESPTFFPPLSEMNYGRIGWKFISGCFREILRNKRLCVLCNLSSFPFQSRSTYAVIAAIIHALASLHKKSYRK